jgi:hypothetical protein
MKSRFWVVMLAGLIAHACASKDAGTAADAGLGGEAEEPASADAGGSTRFFGSSCEPANPFPTTCTFEETCAALGCGDGFSIFGEDGCQHFCENDSDCGPEQRCRFTALSGEGCPSRRVVEMCDKEEGTCKCYGSADCYKPDICVDATRFSESEDCAVQDMSCEELRQFQENAAADETPPAGSAKAAAFAVCNERVRVRLAELDCPQ